MIDIGYGGAVAIFVVGVAMSLCVVSYILVNYFKTKDQDATEGE